VTQPDNAASDFTNLARKLDLLDQAITEAVERSRSRNRSFAKLSVFMFVFLVFYLGYAYHRFGGEVTPDLVAANAQASFQQYVPQAREQLQQQLVANARRFVGGAFDEVKALPGQFADNLNKESADRMDAAMPSVEDQLFTALSASLDTAEKNNKGGPDKPRFQEMLSALGDVYATETINFVNDAHRTYASQAVEFIDYLDRLASSQHLDRRDQLYRDMFVTIFALVRQHDLESGTEDHLKLNILEPAQ
jgi:hypothetical protein